MSEHRLVERISAQWCSTVTEGDISAFEQLYTPDAVVWTNQGGTYTLAHHVALVRKLKTLTTDWLYSEVRVQPTTDGYVQEHVVSGVQRAEPFRVHVAVVAWLDGDRIARLHEYFARIESPK